MKRMNAERDTADMSRISEIQYRGAVHNHGLDILDSETTRQGREARAGLGARARATSFSYYEAKYLHKNPVKLAESLTLVYGDRKVALQYGSKANT